MKIEFDHPLPNSVSRLIKGSIIAIHGLNPRGREDHAGHTWETSSGRLWLRDLDALPRQAPWARTLLYEYNSSPAFGTDNERFVHQANSLLECILIARREVRRNLFLADSVAANYKTKTNHCSTLKGPLS